MQEEKNVCPCMVTRTCMCKNSLVQTWINLSCDMPHKILVFPFSK